MNKLIIGGLAMATAIMAGAAHLETQHFKSYKEGTPHMIKSLSLVPMSPLDSEGMKLIFKKNTIERN